MNRLMSELAGVCRAHPVREKILVVPSYLAGHQAIESLALEGVPWINLRPMTPRDLAAGLAEPEFSSNGAAIASRGHILRLIEQSVRDHARRGGLTYFRNLGSSAGLARAFLGAVHDLRMGGVPPEALEPDMFVDRQKGTEVRAILSGYEEGLKREGLADEAALYEVALRLLQSAGGAAGSSGSAGSAGGAGSCAGPLYIVPGWLELEPLARRFVNHLTAGRRLDLAGEQAAHGTPGSTGFRPAEGPACEFFAAYGASNEVREVLRRVKAEGIPLDSVTVCYTSGSVYIPLFVSASALLGIPVTYGEGLPVECTHAGRMALWILRWIEEDYSSALLYRMLVSGDMDEPAGFRIASVLRDCSVGWGRSRYAAKILDYLGQEAARSGRRESAEALGELTRGLMQEIPEAGDGGLVDARLMCSGIENLVRRLSRISSETDAGAIEAVAAALRDVAESLVCDMIHVREAIDRIKAGLSGVKTGASRPKPGHLHITGLREAGWDNRPHTFIVGLSSGDFPGDPVQDPVLLDVERALICDELERRCDRPHRMERRMAEFLASRRGNVYASYPCRDAVDGRPFFPSPFLLTMYRQSTGSPRATYAQFADSLGPSRAYAPGDEEHAVTAIEWWMRHPGPLDEAEVRRTYPDLDRASNAQALRGSEEFTSFDGLVAPDSSLDPRLNDALNLHATGIEMLARCPFAFFLRYVLGIASPEDVAFEPGVWLDPMSRGALLHEIYRLCLERATAGGGFDLPCSEEVMTAAGPLIESFRNRIPPPSDLVFEREIELIRRSLDVFLRITREMAGEATPAFLEFPFGPIAIPLPGGGAVRVKGRIDRIDRVNGGDGHTYRVWDYKTGSFRGFADKDYIKKGTQIQHVLYAIAAELALRLEGIDPSAVVETAGYLFLTEKGEGRLVKRPSGKRGIGLLALERIAGIMASGAFNATTDRDACEYCDFGPVCRKPRAAMDAAAKVANENNLLLADWRRLQEYD